MKNKFEKSIEKAIRNDQFNCDFIGTLINTMEEIGDSYDNVKGILNSLEVKDYHRASKSFPSNFLGLPTLFELLETFTDSLILIKDNLDILYEKIPETELEIKKIKNFIIEEKSKLE